MRRKSIQDTVAPASGKDSLAGISRAMAHAAFMHQNGHLSAAEVADLRSYAANAGLEHLPESEWTKMYESGDLDRVRADFGYPDGTDPEVEDARRHAVSVKVLTHLLSTAARDGLIDRDQALQVIRQHTEVPEGDDPIGALCEHCSTPDRRLPGPGGDDMSDAQLEAALGMGDGHPMAVIRDKS